MRVLVCGGRDLDRVAAWNWLEANAKDEISFVTGVNTPGIGVLIHGDARGADQGGADWGRSEHAQVIAFPANWKRDGKQAGYLRNVKMLNEGRPDVVIALPGGKGTAMMVRLARDAGIPVVEAK